MKVKLNIDGLSSEAYFDDTEIDEVHKPLLKILAEKQKKLKRRMVVFLAAPPGTGKSTLVSFWEYLAMQEKNFPALQSLPMDGFHHYNAFLSENNLRQFKGAPQTFDVHKLHQKLQDLHKPVCYWPQYDRNLHEPVEDAIFVEAPLVIVEGNWLLLNQPEWQSLRALCDFSIFIAASPEMLSERLISRKMRGGLTREQATTFFHTSDGPNILNVLENSQPADMTMVMNEHSGYSIVP